MQASRYKDNELSDGIYFQYVTETVTQTTINMNANRSSNLFELLVLDLHFLLSNEAFLETIVESLDSLCIAINGAVEMNDLINSEIPDIILQFLREIPNQILTIFKYVLENTDKYDEFFIGETEFLQELYDEQIVNRSIIASIVVSISSRNPESMLAFIDTFTKAMVVIKEIPQFIFNIIPVLDSIHTNWNSISQKVVNSISQFFLSNNLAIILGGIQIIQRSIECGNVILMKSFEESQVQYESLLCSDELKKIAAGYLALSATLSLQNSMDCIRKSHYIFQKAIGHIQIVGNVIKKSIFQYIIEYTFFTKSCIPKPLLFQLFVLTEQGNFAIQNEAINCISIIIRYTTLNILDFPNIVDMIISHINLAHKFNYNLLCALLNIIEKLEIQDSITQDIVDMLSSINFEDLQETENPKLCEICDLLLLKLSQFQNQEI